MIRKVVVKNFKKFVQQEFEIPDHLVIAGPNNSGKTTLLQAIAAWSQIASQWLERNRDLSREDDENYPSTNLNVLRFASVPLADFDHLWRDKNVRAPTSVWLHTDQWKIGFEIIYKETELAAIRPAKEVRENDLEKYINVPLIPVYVPPLSGVDIEEPLFDPVVILARLARAQAGSVLRNMLLAVSQDAQKWQKLQEVIRSFFGYELENPSGGPAIFARYRHSAQDPWYDLSSAASGFLQILLVYAGLLYGEASVLLLDEPDAHLHILLQDKIYHDVRDYARQSGSQLIIATHSERLINAAARQNLCVLLDGQAKIIADTSERRALITSLTALDNVDITLALSAPGILYVEGDSDIAILRAWAEKLAHPLFPFLDKPFWKPTVYQTHRDADGIKAKRHFEALKLVQQDIPGIELRDSDGREVDRGPRILQNGLARMYWERYEIESYLIHPASIARFVESVSGKEARDRASAYMEQQLPPVVYRSPLEFSDYWQGTKAKVILSKIMQEAGLDVHERDYYQIAAQMRTEEIHPEVVKKLDAIADHFKLNRSERDCETGE